MTERDDDELTRSDMALVRQAIRQDWPIPAAVQKKILQRLVDYVDRDHEDGATAPDRTVIAAARTLASFGSLSLRQQALDLRREELEARRPEGSLTVADAMRVIDQVERSLDASTTDRPTPEPPR